MRLMHRFKWARRAVVWMRMKHWGTRAELKVTGDLVQINVKDKVYAFDTRRYMTVIILGQSFVAAQSTGYLPRHNEVCIYPTMGGTLWIVKPPHFNPWVLTGAATLTREEVEQIILAFISHMDPNSAQYMKLDAYHHITFQQF